tara:strand:+ start:461 stop:793 length:333 start_codon:yes stop_codon:yes gene_type:complete
LIINADTPIIMIDGEEHVDNMLDGWERKISRVYTLDDGSKWTVRMVVDKIPNATNSCVRARLKAHTDPAKIFMPVRGQAQREDRFVSPKDLLDPQEWMTDPMIKLVLKTI